MRHTSAVIRGVAAVFVAAAAALFVAPGIAAAAPSAAVQQAAKALGPHHPVYVAPGAPVQVSQDAVAGAKTDLVVASLPASAGSSATTVAEDIGTTTFGNAKGSVLAILGTDVGTATNRGSDVGSAIAAAVRQASADHPLSSGNGDAFVKDALARINDAKAGSASSSSSGGGGHTGLIVGLVIAAIVIFGGGGLLFHRKRMRERELQRRLADRRADVMTYYDRLGADVTNLDPGEDKVARQALADASERYTSAGSQLERANSEGEYDAVRRTLLEGLQGAQTARKRLGLDPGPDLPEVAPTVGDRLTSDQEFTVGDKTVRGYRDYYPGAPYYYGGGGGYGAGWYSMPFWETMMIGSMMGGGFGGWGGAGYGAGYDSGFDQGYDQGADQSNDNGWGSGDSGGGWGSGDSGGGWGSGDSGGDWGGGGGDWGGGGDGGGGGW